MSLADVVDLLRCPVCAAAADVPLALLPAAGSSATAGCAQGHRFDIARQGYLNLLGGPPPRHADTAAMVAARDRVLSGPAYAAVQAAVADAAVQAAVADAAVQAAVAEAVAGAVPGAGTRRSGVVPMSVLDCGGGTGHYLAATMQALAARRPEGRCRGVVLDISAPAARRAARWALPLGAVVADAWKPLPIRSAAVGTVLSVFAPRQAVEFARVLDPAGALVVAHPAPDHLAELRDRLGLIGQQPDKAERLEAALSPLFTRTSVTTVRVRARWSAATIADVVGMGPNAFHTDLGPAAGELDGTPVTVAVEVSTWRRTPSGAPGGPGAR